MPRAFAGRSKLASPSAAAGAHAAAARTIAARARGAAAPDGARIARALRAFGTRRRIALHLARRVRVPGGPAAGGRASRARVRGAIRAGIRRAVLRGLPRLTRWRRHVAPTAFAVLLIGIALLAVDVAIVAGVDVAAAGAR